MIILLAKWQLFDPEPTNIAAKFRVFATHFLVNVPMDLNGQTDDVVGAVDEFGGEAVAG
jgi:hypothetical protein